MFKYANVHRKIEKPYGRDTLNLRKVVVCRAGEKDAGVGRMSKHCQVLFIKTKGI